MTNGLGASLPMTITWNFLKRTELYRWRTGMKTSPRTSTLSGMIALPRFHLQSLFMEVPFPLHRPLHRPYMKLLIFQSRQGHSIMPTVCRPHLRPPQPPHRALHLHQTAKATTPTLVVVPTIAQTAVLRPRPNETMSAISQPKSIRRRPTAVTAAAAIAGAGANLARSSRGSTAWPRIASTLTEGRPSLGRIIFGDI